MSIKVGTKVKVSRDATYKVKMACKAAKKTYLTGTIVDYDGCCGCYIVEFTKNIGTDGLFGTDGKKGHLDEIKPSFITIGKAPVTVKATKETIKVGDVVEWTGINYGPARKGALGIVRKYTGKDGIGVEFVKGYRKNMGHDLDMDIKDGRGWWVSRRDLKIVEPTALFAIGDKVIIVERHDAASKGMKGVIVGIDEGKASHPYYGVQFPGWEGGHSLDSTLTGDNRLEGQWVPVESLRLLDVKEPLVEPAPKPKVLLGQPAPMTGTKATKATGSRSSRT